MRVTSIADSLFLCACAAIGVTLQLCKIGRKLHFTVILLMKLHSHFAPANFVPIQWLWAWSGP